MLVAAVAALGVAGCTGSSDPAPLPTVTTASPSPSSTPTPTGPQPPEKPADITRMDKIGAAAAAKYFIELYGYVLQTGDLTEWDAMSFPNCEYCSKTHEYVAGIYVAGGSVEGADIRAEVVTVHDLDELVGGYPVDLKVTQGATTQVDAAGAEVASIGQSTEVMQLQTVYYGTAWTIAGANTYVAKS